MSADSRRAAGREPTDKVGESVERMRDLTESVAAHNERIHGKPRQEADTRPGQFIALRNGTGKFVDCEVFYGPDGRMILYIKGAGTFHADALPDAVRAVERVRVGLSDDQSKPESEGVPDA